MRVGYGVKEMPASSWSRRGRAKIAERLQRWEAVIILQSPGGTIENPAWSVVPLGLGRMLHLHPPLKRVGYYQMVPPRPGVSSILRGLPPVVATFGIPLPIGFLPWR